MTIYTNIPVLTLPQLHCTVCVIYYISYLCSLRPLKTWKLPELGDPSRSLRGLDLPLSLCLIVVSSPLSVRGIFDSANCQSWDTHKKQQNSQPVRNPLCHRSAVTFDLLVQENLVKSNSSWFKLGRTGLVTLPKLWMLTYRHLTLQNECTCLGYKTKPTWSTKISLGHIAPVESLKLCLNKSFWLREQSPGRCSKLCQVISIAGGKQSAGFVLQHFPQSHKVATQMPLL